MSFSANCAVHRLAHRQDPPSSKCFACNVAQFEHMNPHIHGYKPNPRCSCIVWITSSFKVVSSVSKVSSSLIYALSRVEIAVCMSVEVVLASHEIISSWFVLKISLAPLSGQLTICSVCSSIVPHLGHLSVLHSPLLTIFLPVADTPAECFKINNCLAGDRNFVVV